MGCPDDDQHGTRAQTDDIHGLPLDSRSAPAALSLTSDGKAGRFDAVTVYATARQGDLSGVARLDLYAEVLGVAAPVASAFVPAGFSGPVMVAAGFQADLWHVYASATRSDLRLRLAMASCACCCSGPDVAIPAELSEFPLDALAPGQTLQDVAPILAEPMAPWGA